MGSWIRNNLVLIGGIVLPVLLVGGFFILSASPRVLADPPQYDFLLVGYRFDYQHPADYYLSFEVREGRLTGRVVPTDSNAAHPNRQSAGIFRYRAETNTFEQLVFDLPEDLSDMEEPVALNLDETDGLKLDKRNRSPDGYTFEFLGYRGRHGLLGELFGMRRSHESNYVLKKDKGYVDLPGLASTPYYQNDLHLMGWIIEEGNTP